MSQTTVSDSFVVAVAGLLADSGGDFFVETCVAGEDLPAGSLVAGDGTITVDGRRQVKLVGSTGATGDIRGIVQYRSTAPRRPAVNGVYPPAVLAGEAIPVIRKGRVWANFVGANVVADQALQVRVTQDTDKGSLSGTAVDANNLATGLKAKKANVGTLVLTDINLP